MINHRGRNAYRGAILLIVLVTVVILSLAGYTFCLLMQTEEAGARVMGQRMQSRYLCDSAIDATKVFLSHDKATIEALGGTYSNPTMFQNVVVRVDPDNENLLGRFTVIAPLLDQEGMASGFRYGLTDESTRLNLNILPLADQMIPGAGRQLLMSLPDMTEDIADAILDWMDEDEDVRDYGAEYSYYTGLSPAYAPKNGPMDSLEELLLVRGVTPQMLFGMDSNHNGILDANEMATGGALSPDMVLGWANYLTLFSKESNLNANKLQRININSEDLEQLYTDLRSVFNEEWASFIIWYRINGPYNGSDDVDQSAIYTPIDFETAVGSYTFSQILDLIDATTSVETAESLNPIPVESPIKVGNLPFTMPILMENLTTQQGATIPGRININQAPRRLLEGIPGITPEIVDQIIQKRELVLDDPEGADKNRKYGTWILVEGYVDLPTMRLMFPFVCAGGDVYRAEAVGYIFDDSSEANHAEATSRVEAIIDTTEAQPRILFWRDKSHLSSGYTLETLGIGLGQF
jgi:DNA uptake protein ComE-like DNA-binding protein